MANLAVEAEQLGKRYRRYVSPWRRALETASFGGWRGHDDMWALRAVDLALPRGLALGLVGANGAGKSTLLKLLARTTPPSEGRFRVAGRLCSLLELGAGFHHDFTGRENIALAGMLLGISAEDVRARQAAIIDFAELGEFIDEPVRTYSTGMGLRLGFAVAATLEPDVLLLDEVLAVGDAYFQKKCVDRVLELKSRGCTILFASHSLYDVRQLCDEALWLERGRPASSGDSASVTHAYAAFQREHVEHDAALRAKSRDETARRTSEMPGIVAASVHRSSDGATVWELESGDDVEVRVEWFNPHSAREGAHLGVAFMRHDRTLVAACGTHLDGVELAGERGVCSLMLPKLALLSGSFLVLVILFDESGVHRHHELVLEHNLVVKARSSEVGLVRVEHAWRGARASDAERQCA